MQFVSFVHLPFVFRSFDLFVASLLFMRGISYCVIRRKLEPLDLVSFAAIIRVVTQRFSPTGGGEALRDDPNNGCEGDYVRSC